MVAAYKVFSSATIFCLFTLLTGSEFSYAKSTQVTVAKNSKNSATYSRTIVLNSKISKILDQNLEKALLFILSDEVLKSYEKNKRIKIQKQAKKMRSDKDKLIADLLKNVEAELMNKFDEAELKYVSELSNYKVFQKIGDFIISKELSNILKEPYKKANMILEEK
ncbi:MAG: hypothetical protein WA160_04955 [Pseudobdellovibrio sp.]